MSTNSFSICVLTLNPGPEFLHWLSLATQAVNGADILVIDSTSSDNTRAYSEAAGVQIKVIARADFDHGATRDQALRWVDKDIVVFMTQDALLKGQDDIVHLINAFDNPAVGAAYGRQIPHPDATPIAAHARYFNYPATSYLASAADIPKRGIKTAFLSNSFAAYRRNALLNVGGFPCNTILSEDMIAGARLLQAGWELAYVADACVYHSHNYSPWQEFKRYFDIGVLHRREPWLINWLGKAEGEGARFVGSEVRYLLKHAPWQLPEAGIRTLLKYAGYRAGKMEQRLPLAFKRACSMNRRYWR